MMADTAFPILDIAWNLERQALLKWGETAQRLMVCEEGAELVVAVAQHARGRATDDEVLDEAADAIIVACTAAVLANAGPAALTERIRAKLRRLEERLGGAPSHGTVPP
jgi:NTP pyrophosphatase (non-canonical NTP hydrolase)